MSTLVQDLSKPVPAISMLRVAYDRWLVVLDCGEIAFRRDIGGGADPPYHDLAGALIDVAKSMRDHFALPDDERRAKTERLKGLWGGE